MSKLALITGKDNEILRAKSALVQKIDKKTKKFTDNMIETLNKENGLGLAAPQVGKNIRIIVARLNYDTSEEMIIPMINPEIIYRSKETVTGEEGCLSLPGLYDKVERHKQIRVKFTDIKDNAQILELDDLNARIIQHETDHLNGVLFIDLIKEPSKEEITSSVAL
jgi:peptide deformylase